MTLRRFFIAVVFLLALHLNLKLHSADFDIAVSYENNAVTITTDKSLINNHFSTEEAEDAAIRDKDLYIGTYTVTVTSDYALDYTVYVHAASQYVNPEDDRFQALTRDGADPIKMAVIANQDPDGTIKPRPLFNDQTVIDHGATHPDPTIELLVDHYCLAETITDAFDDHSHFPIVYILEGP